MLIRSQNKTILIDTKTLVINEDATIMAIQSNELYFKLGKYDSYDEAEAVLDDIQKHYSYITTRIYEMPEHAWQLADIAELNLSIRACHLLRDYGIDTIGEIESHDITKIQGIGKKTIQEIEEKLLAYKEEKNKHE